VSEGSASQAASIQRFRLTATPPLRALAISAGAALLGAAGVVLASALGWPGWTIVVAVTVLGLAILLAVVALVAARRLQATVVLEESAITVVSGRARDSLAWSHIERVVQEGPRLTLVARQGVPAAADLVVLRPGPESDAVFARLVSEIRSRLDRDRGYRNAC